MVKSSGIHIFDFKLNVFCLLQNPNVSIGVINFTIGSSRHCNFPLKDQTISPILCKIKHSQVLSWHKAHYNCEKGSIFGFCIL